jgi:hypothetical protein
LHILNKAIIYARDNELCDRIIICHVHLPQKIPTPDFGADLIPLKYALALPGTTTVSPGSSQPPAEEEEVEEEGEEEDQTQEQSQSHIEIEMNLRAPSTGRGTGKRTGNGTGKGNVAGTGTGTGIGRSAFKRGGRYGSGSYDDSFVEDNLVDRDREMDRSVSLIESACVCVCVWGGGVLILLVYCPHCCYLAHWGRMH